jgi:hypothetical protein
MSFGVLRVSLLVPVHVSVPFLHLGLVFSIALILAVVSNVEVTSVAGFLIRPAPDSPRLELPFVVG